MQADIISCLQIIFEMGVQVSDKRRNEGYKIILKERSVRLCYRVLTAKR